MGFYLGLMSGTSMDAIDAALVDFDGSPLRQRDTTVTGFDTGPASRLLDAWISLHQGKEFDADGAWAGTGRCDDSLLDLLMDEPYLKLPPRARASWAVSIGTPSSMA
jgi:1,6-anhydro-N-acetylmuramate kinase